MNFDLENFISILEESQRSNRRHRSAIEAYTLGFFHGLNGQNNHLAIKDKFKIASQMRDFGLSMVAKGVVNATHFLNTESLILTQWVLFKLQMVLKF